MRTKRVKQTLAGVRGLGNGLLAAAILLALLPSSVAEVCTSAGLCFTRGAAILLGSLLVVAATAAANLLRKDETRREAGEADGPVLEDVDATRSLTRDLVLPLVGLGVLALIAGVTFLAAAPGLVIGGLVAFVALRAAARVLYYLRKPPTFYPVAVGLLRGASVAAFAVLGLLAFVPDGPGMPLSAIQLGLFVLSVSFLRQHKTLVKGPGLPILLSLVAAIAVGAWGGWNAWKYLLGGLPIPYLGQGLWLAALAYGVLAIRALLAFAGEDEAGKNASWVEWLRANLLRNAVFAGLLVLYVIFRDDLAQIIPLFPIVEFSLGMAVLGAVLARVRGRIRATLAETPVTATWRRHEQRIEKIAEADHDRVSEVLGAFLTHGTRRDEYAEVFVKASGAEGEAAAAIARPVQEYVEIRRASPLPWPAPLVAAALVAVGIAVGVHILILNNSPPGTEVSGTVQLGFLLAGLGVWATQWSARRSESLVGVAVAGTLGTILALGAIFGWLRALVDRQIGPDAPFLDSVPVPFLVVLALLAAVGFGIPAYVAWRLRRALVTGTVERVEADRAALAVAGLKKHAKMIGGWLVAAFIITFPASFLITFLANRGTVDEGFRDAYLTVQVPILVLLLALSLASGALLIGYAMGRPLVKREDAEIRARRRELHARMMTAVTGEAHAAWPDTNRAPTPAAASRASAVTMLLRPFAKR